jgi:formylglycine-generating enzyme required for sulfatase activity
MPRSAIAAAGAWCLAASLLAAAEPRPTQLELLRTFRQEFIEITPGEADFPAEFDMGRRQATAAERPVHRVTFRYRFAVAAYEVPQNLWEAVTGQNPSRWKGPRNAVELVDFDDCQDFCFRVTALLRQAGLIDPQQQVRLPSEAEWEYCARAGSRTAYSFGDDPLQLPDYAWFTLNAAGNDPPVGAKRPNPWKLYDVHGYLWEWCQDTWHDDYQGAPADGSAWEGPGPNVRRVLRGGSWKERADSLTSSFRRAAEPSFRDDAVGLRCILAGHSPPPPAAPPPPVRP